MQKPKKSLTELSANDNFNAEGDDSREGLLSLDGVIMEVGGGYWAKFEARVIDASTECPHGLSYSLCLFAPDDARVLCFDNAHTITTGNGPSKRRTTTRDHVHRGNRMRPYDFSDAGTLLEDFWNAAEKALKAAGVK